MEKITAPVGDKVEPPCVMELETHDEPEIPLPFCPVWGESEERLIWFEYIFFKRIPVKEFLSLASASRGDGHNCRFGERAVGGCGVALTIIFDDGIEWIVKVPKEANDDDKEDIFLMSEYAALLILQGFGDIPTPKVYGFCFDRKNPAKTPYFFMDKVPGKSLIEAILGGMGREQVHETIRQLAQIKKILHQHPFKDIGSFTIIDNETLEWGIDSQCTKWNYVDSRKHYRCRQGPYESTLEYYASQLHISWSNFQDDFVLRDEGETILERWKIHSFLVSILLSYIKPDDNTFYITHSDLSAANIFVDEGGNITGLIDWGFTSTLPFQSAEQYPFLLMREYEERFSIMTEEIYEDPIAELREWREIYAREFDGDSRMEDYLKTIDATIAFESILRDENNATLENLIENFKFLQSPSALDNIGLHFPWTRPHPNTSETPTAQPMTETPSVPSMQIISPTIHTEEPMTREIATQTDVTNVVMDQLSMESRSLNSFVVERNRKRGVKLRHCVRRVMMKVKNGMHSTWRALSNSSRRVYQDENKLR